MSNISVKKWLIAQIKRNSYNLAIRNVERQGFESYLPQMKTTIIKQNKFINKNVFVFPGYMFIGFNSQKLNWTKINSTVGLSKVLTYNNKPAEISNDIILALKDRYEENISITSKHSLKKGDTIKFNNGPFVDLIARIEYTNNLNRVWVLLDVMGGHQKLKLQQTTKLKYIKV